MSFGFSVGDILSVTLLAHKTFTALKSAPKEFSSLSLEVLSLHTTLQSLSEECTSPASILSFAPASRQESLRQILEHCAKGLQQLDKLVRGCTSLGEGERRRFFERVDFAGREKDAPRRRLALHTASLNIFLTGLTHGSLGRVEHLLNGRLQGGAQVLKGKSVDEGVGDDGFDGAWAAIGRRLAREGVVSVQEIRGNEDEILDEVKEYFEIAKLKKRGYHIEKTINAVSSTAVDEPTVELQKPKMEIDNLLPSQRLDYSEAKKKARLSEEDRKRQQEFEMQRRQKEEEEEIMRKRIDEEREIQRRRHEEEEKMRKKKQEEEIKIRKLRQEEFEIRERRRPEQRAPTSARAIRDLIDSLNREIMTRNVLEKEMESAEDRAAWDRARRRMEGSKRRIEYLQGRLREEQARSKWEEETGSSSKTSKSNFIGEDGKRVDVDKKKAEGRHNIPDSKASDKYRKETENTSVDWKWTTEDSESEGDQVDSVDELVDLFNDVFSVDGDVLVGSSH